MKNWKSLSLTMREDHEIDLRDKEKESLLSLDNVKLCIVAKVMLQKKINTDAFRAVMISIWKIHNATRIENAGDNVFVIQFRSFLENARVLADGPWTFDRALIILNSPNDFESINSLVFSHTQIWIQIHNVPFKYLTRDMAQNLGEIVGSVIEIDCDENDVWTGPFMRLRVTIDINKPLRRGLKLRIDIADVVWCPIFYEKLPDFCHNCGIIGHTHRECQVISGEDHSSAGYGEWMRATIMKKSVPHRWVGRQSETVNQKDFTMPSGRGGRAHRWRGGTRSDATWWRNEFPNREGPNNSPNLHANILVAESNIEGNSVRVDMLKTDLVLPNEQSSGNVEIGLGVSTKAFPSRHGKNVIQFENNPIVDNCDEYAEMEVLSSEENILQKRQNKKYKAKKISQLSDVLCQPVADLTFPIKAGDKRKSVVTMEEASVAKKPCMRNPLVNDESVEAVEQPRREL